MSYSNGHRRKFDLFGWSLGWFEWLVILAALVYGIYTHFEAKEELVITQKQQQVQDLQSFIDKEVLPAMHVQAVLANQCTQMYALSNLKNVNGTFEPGDVTEAVAKACKEKAMLQQPLPQLPDESK
ncbi:hypothetical protein D3C81_889400 [compost metagenome]